MVETRVCTERRISSAARSATASMTRPPRALPAHRINLLRCVILVGDSGHPVPELVDTGSSPFQSRTSAFHRLAGNPVGRSEAPQVVPVSSQRFDQLSERAASDDLFDCVIHIAQPAGRIGDNLGHIVREGGGRGVIDSIGVPVILGVGIEHDDAYRSVRGTPSICTGQLLRQKLCVCVEYVVVLVLLVHVQPGRSVEPVSDFDAVRRQANMPTAPHVAQSVEGLQQRMEHLTLPITERCRMLVEVSVCRERLRTNLGCQPAEA